MVDHNSAAHALPASGTEPVSTADLRARSPRNRAVDVADEDPVVHHAVERREPGRQGAALELARACARIADDNRGKDVVLLDLRGATAIVDYFVIVTANSRRLANAIASEIDHQMKQRGEAKLGMEGSEEGRWTLIDYGDFVVHVFSPDDRAFYALEEIWGDAPQLEWQEASAADARGELSK